MRRQSICVLAVVILLCVMGHINVFADSKMYWTGNYYGPHKIQRANLDGSDVEDLVLLSGASETIGIALDISAGKMYWADSYADKIQSANLDGSEVTDLVSNGLSYPVGIALDISAGKMYWADNVAQKIQCANLDGSEVTDLVTSGIIGPTGIALDISAGKMYWADIAAQKIQCANLDGSEVTDLVIGGIIGPIGIALDISAGKMYWADYDGHKIQCANLDGSGVTYLVTSGISEPIGIALDISAGTMYWTGGSSGRIQRANLDGSGMEDLITGLEFVMGIALDVPELPIGNYIDWADIAVLAGRWLNNDCSMNSWCVGADLDRNNKVDFVDLALLGQYFSKMAPAPGQANSPDPNDGETGVRITSHLSWVADPNAISHNVFLGKASPGTFQGSQSDIVFDPGTLDAGTAYYWRITEVGIGRMTAGAVWNFTTAPAPSQATNPNPFDTETNVSIVADLIWTAGSDTESHYVYFGTNPTPDENDLQGNQTSTTFDTGTLEYETAYYWRIDGIGPGGKTTGEVWSFTTIIDPNLVGRWGFDETSGNIAYDSSGNENHGTLTDGPDDGLVWAPAEDALNFDGSNNLSRVVIPTSGMTTAMGTVSVWANLTEPQIRGGGRNGSGYFFGCDNGGINKILLYMSNSNTQLDMKVGNHGEINLITLNTGIWYHIALTWNTGAYAVYVNGLMLDTGSYSGLVSLPSTADIGNNGSSSTQSFHGLMGDVQVYDKSLSTTEIQELYQDVTN
ncbi:MAG: hypothetical protein FVQ85_02905 [Planctomycetes bacterium]|nr:hypothetical protein [Planctomycetota bacterium]